MERRMAYGPIKEALKERGIRYQAPYKKMQVHWDSEFDSGGSGPDSTRRQGDGDNERECRDWMW